MKTITIYLFLFIAGLAASGIQAQNDSIPGNVKGSSAHNLGFFEKEKEKIIKEEKDQLRLAIEGINYRLEKEMITAETAARQKAAAAEKHALNIENRINILANEMEIRERNKEHQNYLSL